MAEGVSSPLTFRDFIRHLLPTATALCLFLPLFRIPNEKFEVAAIVFASVVLGYLVTTPLTDLIAVTYRCTPIMKVFNRRRAWMAGNWDYDKLFYGLSQEEREYLYVTLGYLELYRQLSFYLLIYAGANLFLLLNAVRGASDVNSFFLTAVDARTNAVGGVLLPTWLLLILSLVLAYYSFRDFLNEFEILFHEAGQYSTFAARVHEKDGGFATSVSGVVRGKENGVLSGVKVTLQDIDGKELETTSTDLDGYFQFDNSAKQYPFGDYKLVINEGEAKSISLADKVVPSFTIESTLTPATEPKLKRPRSMTFLMIIIVAVLILSVFVESDWRVKILYTLSIVPHVGFVYMFFRKPTKLDSPILSAALILSVALAVTGLLNSISTFASLDSYKALRWTNLMVPFLTQRWYDVAIFLLVIFSLCLVNRNVFEQQVSNFRKEAQLPKLNPNGITFDQTPTVDPVADQIYEMSLAGENLHDMSLTVPENVADKIEVLTSETKIDPAGRSAKVSIKVLRGTSPGTYELPFNVELPKVGFTLAAQPPPDALELFYGSDRLGQPPAVADTEQHTSIVILGKNLNGAILIPAPPLTISEVKNTSPDKLQAIVTIPGATPPGNDYTIGVKNTNPQTASIKFIVRSNTVSK
jgi:hypothetical protein